ncbi:MAG: hypothetical protein CMI02_07685 [Oceanospirillaceae bacterium]|nr:hypothetical protein [Oceanospirillaceae bacterium]MBT11899.1 hypothetical protein [Oceanospirillaceae bacterium]|tara:strand:+ start:12663 stop:13655 length:993 start_codon:yes stop_codon:yes gene_type:complete
MLKKIVKPLALAAALTASSLSMAADKVTFQLDWLPGGDKAPVYVGIKEGIFEKAGLDVSISSGRGSTDAVTKMATGQSDVGTADIGALLAARAQDDVPVSAVLAYFSQAPHAFFTVKGNGVETIKDVKGKKVATSPFTSSNLFLPLVLEENGLQEKDVTLLKTDPGALGPMLMTGNVPVIIAWTTNVPLFEKQAAEAGKELIVLPWSEAGLELYSSSLLAADKFLEERPDVAKRFVKAFAEAVAFTYANPDKAGEDIHSIVPEVDADTAAAQIKSIKGLVYNSATDADGYGALTKERMAMTWKWVAKANKLDADKADPETMVNRDFMPEK